jgi:GntR family transcriptional regulator, transcriptional repressor for pyruvate dehydrogenase complex
LSRGFQGGAETTEEAGISPREARKRGLNAISVVRQNLSTMITEQIRDMVLSGQLDPGAQVPGHRDLAAMFGVSVSSVREAISALIFAGILETRHGRGTFVSQRPQLDVARASWLGTTSDRASMRELREARGVLERAIAGFAATRATSEEVQALRRAVDAMMGTVDDAEGHIESDLAFHLTMAVAAHNRALLQAVHAIRATMKRELDINIRRIVSEGDAKPGVLLHAQLIEAVAAHDPVAAEKCVDRIMARVPTHPEVLDRTTPGAPAMSEGRAEETR